MPSSWEALLEQFKRVNVMCHNRLICFLWQHSSVFGSTTCQIVTVVDSHITLRTLHTMIENGTSKS
jgi:hypothetical protein